ncbi:hypothetical protein R9X47_21375 [Wukongibacter baidiensis]|uniref:hypothetical protein n=1 Tax=Wukongibacter baidiensis TaxID=1723361 RepID=UPI003D7F628F
MKLKIGIVGHRRRMQKINETAKAYFKNIEIVTILIDEIPNTTEFVKMIKSAEQYLDGIIFTGHVPYDILINVMIPKIPWDYIPRDYSQLLRTFLEAILIHKKSIFKVSIDSYDMDTVLRVYDEIGIEKDQLNIFIADQSLYDDNFFQYLKSFHEKNFYENKVSCCITGLSNVYTYLVSKNIPCLSLDPTADVIKQTLHRFQLRNEANINKSSQIVVLSIEIDLTSEYSLISENEYQIMVEKMKVSEDIYLFAQKIQGAVVEVGVRGYLIFCTKSILERETKNLQKLDLLKVISENTSNTLSVGIGYGITAREAKYSANLGMQRAKKNGGNQAFVVYNGKNFVGPILADKDEDDPQKVLIDETFHNIANETELSINTIFKLHCIAEQNKKDCFTPKELAADFGVTLRSMNRILEKLEKGGYAEIVGKRVMSNAGRPSRIIKILF